MKKSKLTKSTLIAISMAASFAISSSSYAVVLSNNPSESQIGALIGSDKCGIDLNFDDAAGGRYIVGDTRENDLLEDSFGRTFAIVNKDKLGCIDLQRIEMTATYPTWAAAELKNMSNSEVYKLQRVAAKAAKSRLKRAQAILSKNCKSEIVDGLNQRIEELNANGKAFTSLLCSELAR